VRCRARLRPTERGPLDLAGRRVRPCEVTTKVDVEESVRISPVTLERVTTRQRMRRFLQIQYAQRTYFKAFGDTRVVSRTNGEVFDSIDELRGTRPDDDPATEILHFAIPSPRSPYGIPRWVGALIAVLGSRQMEEVNFSYFENKSVPPLALLVSGGKLSETSIPRIERFIEDEPQVEEQLHKVLILEAEGHRVRATLHARRSSFGRSLRRSSTTRSSSSTTSGTWTRWGGVPPPSATSRRQSRLQPRRR